MSGFGEWRAYAHPDQVTRSFQVRIVRETSAHEYDRVTEISEFGTAVRHEARDVAVESPALMIQHDVAEALYHALHRVFGDSDPETTKDAYLHERARVDMVLEHLLDYTAPNDATTS